MISMMLRLVFSPRRAMSPLIRKKFRWGTIFPIGLKRYRDPEEEPNEKEPIIELKRIGNPNFKFSIPSSRYVSTDVRSFLSDVLMYIALLDIDIRSGYHQLRVHGEELYNQDLELGAVLFALKTWSEICYHSRKANVVANALSRNERVKPRRVENATAEMMCGLDQLMERKEEVAGHGVPVSIISDRDGRFTSRVLANITESLRDVIDMSSLDKGKAQRGERSSKKIYADNRRKLLEFEVADQVLLNVSPWKMYAIVKKTLASSMYDHLDH
ncbi:hypothetical protein Tco_1516858 [Tanacetum coccineum]